MRGLGGADPALASVPWLEQRALGGARATTWGGLSDLARQGGGAQGMIYTARSCPSRWHLVLFDWLEAGGPRCARRVRGFPIRRQPPRKRRPEGELLRCSSGKNRSAEGGGASADQLAILIRAEPDRESGWPLRQSAGRQGGPPRNLRCSTRFGHLLGDCKRRYLKFRAGGGGGERVWAENLPIPLARANFRPSFLSSR